jgi:hypothetical protein
MLSHAEEAYRRRQGESRWLHPRFEPANPSGTESGEERLAIHKITKGGLKQFAQCVVVVERPLIAKKDVCMAFDRCSHLDVTRSNQTPCSLPHDGEDDLRTDQKTTLVDGLRQSPGHGCSA